MDRRANQRALAIRRAGDLLPDPPDRIGAELDLSTGFVLLDRTQESEDPFLHEIEERQCRMMVPPRQAHHQADVGRHHAIAQGTVSGELVFQSTDEAP